MNKKKSLHTTYVSFHNDKIAEGGIKDEPTKYWLLKSGFENEYHLVTEEGDTMDVTIDEYVGDEFRQEFLSKLELDFVEKAIKLIESYGENNNQRSN